MKAAFMLGLLAVSVAGCGEYKFSPVARGSQVTGPIDGLYGGRTELVIARNGTCPLPQTGTLSVFDARVLYPYSTNITFSAPVGQDGRVHDQIEQATLDGSLIDGALVFDVKTPECESSFTFRRIHGF